MIIFYIVTGTRCIQSTCHKSRTYIK